MKSISRIIVPRTVYHYLAYEGVVAIVFAAIDRWLTAFVVAWIMVLTASLFQAVKVWASRTASSDAKTGWAFGILACIFMVIFSVFLMRNEWTGRLLIAPPPLATPAQGGQPTSQTTLTATSPAVSETVSPSY